MATAERAGAAARRRRFSPSSLAGRLSIVTAGVLAVALGLVATVRTVALRQQLYRSTARQMFEDYQGLVTGVSRYFATPLAVSLNASYIAQVFASPTTGALVYAAGGSILASQPSGLNNLSPAALPRADYHQAMRGKAPLYLLATSGGQEELVVLEPLVGRDGPSPGDNRAAGVLELATSTAPINTTLHQQLEFDVLAELLALVAASVVIYALLGRFLEPLQAMAKASDQIAAGDPDVDLPQPRGEDEVSRLSTAFSHMVQRIDAALEGERAEQRRVRAFLADASHSLRTPLTVLNGRLDLLLRGESRDPEALEGALRDLRVEGERMARIVRGLLLLARLDEGGERPAAEVAIAAVLEALRPRLESLVGDRELTISVSQDLKAWATVDAIETIVTNLVENAVRHTPESGAVEVRADRVDDRARLRVLDTGPGIPPGDLPRIFDRFFRGAKSGHRRDGGAGLGLSIVQRWAEALGGRAEAANRAERSGAVFIVWLRLAPPSEAASGSQ